jgi:hypothetical protein
MSEPPIIPDGERDAQWEVEVRRTASTFAYPPTPDIAGKVRPRLSTRQMSRNMRVARVLAAVLLIALVLGALISVPAVRAKLQEILHIGAITIFVGEPSPTPPPSAVSPTPTPVPPGVLTSVLQLPGETTLADAESQLGRAITLPTYPADLGQPDHVYVQGVDFPLVTLAWLVPGTDDQVRMSLQIVSSAANGAKYEPYRVVDTQVNGRRAMWFENPHQLTFYTDIGAPDEPLTRIIDTHVLVWEADRLTYRLETDLSMEDAVRVAESIE